MSIIGISALQMFASQFDGISTWLLLSALPSILLHMLAIVLSQIKLQKYLMFYGYTVLLVGPFATLGALLIFSGHLAPSGKILAEYRDFIATKVVMSPIEKSEFNLSVNYWEDEDAKITPFTEIMNGQNSEKKRDTINKVVQHPSIYSKDILNIGLKDMDQDIRFYAASGIIMLNDSFIEKFKEYLKNIQTEPEDVENYLNLAISYEKYCAWKLPEEEDLPIYFDKIENAFKKVHALSPKNIMGILGLGKVLLHKKRYHDAEKVLANGIGLYPHSKELAMFMLEALYNQKKFKEVQDLANKISKGKYILNLEIEETVRYWGNA